MSAAWSGGRTPNSPFSATQSTLRLGWKALASLVSAGQGAVWWWLPPQGEAPELLTLTAYGLPPPRYARPSTSGGIQVSASTYQLLLQGQQSRPEDWSFTGGVQVKGKGVMETFLWVGNQQLQPESMPSPFETAVLPGAPESWADVPLPRNAHILRIRSQLEGSLSSHALQGRLSLGECNGSAPGSGTPPKRSPFLSLLSAVADSKTMMAAGGGSVAASPKAGRCSALGSPVSSVDDLPPRRNLLQSTRARTYGGAGSSFVTLSTPPVE